MFRSLLLCCAFISICGFLPRQAPTKPISSPVMQADKAPVPNETVTIVTNTTGLNHYKLFEAHFDYQINCMNTVLPRYSHNGDHGFPQNLDERFEI